MPVGPVVEGARDGSSDLALGPGGPVRQNLV
jgi:hypothetical protein